MDPPRQDADRRPRASALRGCEPLTAAVTRRLYDGNAFRLTGLSITASAGEITKHGEKLRVMQELGQSTKGAWAFAKSPPPTSDDIREALQRLKDPEKRLVDEFFWFWPLHSDGRRDPALDAVVRGDEPGAVQM